MAANIQLRPSQIADLEVIRDIGSDQLRRVLDSLSNVGKCLQPADLQRVLRTHLSSDTADALLRQLLSLRGLMRQAGFKVDEVLEGLRTGLRPSVSNWNDIDLEKWADIEPIFSEILNSGPVRLVAKASDLAYEYANLLQSARIVTDIRPVFSGYNLVPLEIDAALVSFTLRLNFDSRDGDHSLSIALDYTDIQELKEQCERALRKGQMLKKLMQDTANLPTLIVGGSDDEP